MHKERSDEEEENYGDSIFPIFKILNNFTKKNENNENKPIRGGLFSKSVKRIKSEIKAVNENEDNLFNVEADFDIYNWIASIKGTIDSPYEGGLFKLRITFPDNYPFKHPDIRFITKIFCSDVDSDGYICSCALNKYIFNFWTPSNKIVSILSFIYKFIKAPLCKTCAQGNREALSPYFNDKKRFELFPKQWTQSYDHE